jgi:hypothetical protein
MAIVNVSYLKNELASQARQFKGLAYGAANVNLQDAKRKLLEDFDNHEVTKEIKAGPDAESRVLPYGNLFSFIGFDREEDPVSEVRESLQEIGLTKEPAKTYVVGGQLNFDFTVSVPDKADLEKVAPMPGWASGRSWLTAIERGIAGFGSYLFKRNKTFKNSRSGPAVQVSHSIRGGGFKNIPYISEILNKFKARLK